MRVRSAQHLVAGESGVARAQPRADRGVGRVAVDEIFLDEALLQHGEAGARAWRRRAAPLPRRVDARHDLDPGFAQRRDDRRPAQHLPPDRARAARRIPRPPRRLGGIAQHAIFRDEKLLLRRHGLSFG
jgi:hypothetical protein